MWTGRQRERYGDRRGDGQDLPPGGGGRGEEVQGAGGVHGPCGTAPSAFAWQWLRVDSGSDTVIAGATARTYRLVYTAGDGGEEAQGAIGGVHGP